MTILFTRVIFNFFVAGFCLVAFLPAMSQNVGIGTISPLHRLHVVGNICTDSALIMQPTALIPAATIAAPSNVSTLIISKDAATSTANAIAAPATALEGQMLYILNQDNNRAMFANCPIDTGGGTRQFMYLGGRWRTLSPVVTTASLASNFSISATTSSSTSSTVLSTSFTAIGTTAIVNLSCTGSITGTFTLNPNHSLARLHLNGTQLGIFYCIASTGNRFSGHMTFVLTGLTPGSSNIVALQLAVLPTNTGSATYNISTGTSVNHAHMVITQNP